MQLMIRVLSLIAVLACASTAWSQVENKNPPHNPQPAAPPSPGSPQVRSTPSGEVRMGEAAPDFELDGSNERPVKLSSFRGHWLLLAFGDRKEDLGILREVFATLDSNDIRVLGVCGDKSYNVVSYAKRQRVPFLMLADLTREISQMYGLYDWQERKVRPGYLLISPAGEVRLALLGQRFPADDVARLALYVTGHL